MYPKDLRIPAAISAGGRLESFVRSRIRPHLQQRISIANLVNDAFGRAFESIERFSGSTEDAFLGWLAGIAKNVVLMEIDRLHRDQALQLEHEPAADSAAPSRAARREERFDRLKLAIEKLSGDYKEVIMLCRIEGLPIKKVAERMGRSPDAVKKLLWRALAQLKTKFGDTESLHLPDRSLELEEDQDGR